jgi:hypothetical protein
MLRDTVKLVQYSVRTKNALTGICCDAMATNTEGWRATHTQELASQKADSASQLRQLTQGWYLCQAMAPTV